MKNIKKLCLLALIGLMAGSCEKSNPTPQTDCIEGVVIAESRTASDGFSCADVVQITNRNIGESWGVDRTTIVPNCVFIDNLPVIMQKKGTRLYFTSYEQVPERPWVTNCTPPPAFYIVAENLSTKCLSK